MKTLNIAMIGGGNMAEALVCGLLRGGHAPGRIVIAEPRAARRAELEARLGVRCLPDNAEALAGAELVVLAVKPQQMKDALAGLGPALAPDATVLSIAAGVPVARIEQWLGTKVPIVRAMPNTPALVGAGISALFTTAGSPHRERAAYLLGACGGVVWLEDEDQMHAVTALSGSGPAYFFLLAEMMEAAGSKLGLSRELARKLACRTALGAGRMLVESGRSAAELREQVTSPGGTTQAALDVMYDRGLPDAVRAAIQAAARRSRELA